jgi:hypothetical protein
MSEQTTKDAVKLEAAVRFHVQMVFDGMCTVDDATFKITTLAVDFMMDLIKNTKNLYGVSALQD